MGITRGRAERAPRYLLIAHLASLIQGATLLALTVALRFTNLSDSVAMVAAYSLVSGVALFALANILNWTQGVQDAFAEKSLGNQFGAPGTLLMLIGGAIVFLGVIAEL